MSYYEHKQRYHASREWSDLFINRVKQIVGPRMMREADFEIDTRQATDLMVMAAKDIRVACRVRGHYYAERYPFDFTLRSKGPGDRTELQKVIDGWADWMFYGFTNKEQNDLPRWYIIDYSVFRADLIRRRQNIKHTTRLNPDGVTGLTAFDVRSFSPNILVDSSHAVPFFDKESTPCTT